MWVLVFGFFSTAYFSIGVVVLHILRTRSAAHFAERAPARWGASLMWAAGVRLTWENPEHLGNGRSQILVSNHQSWFDVFAIAGGLPVRFSFVGKKELSKIPIFGRAWELVGHYAIDRQNHRAAVASLEVVVKRMKSDRTTLVMFPEGTRSATGQLTPFKKGAFVLAIESQTPVVPVAVLGTRDIMPKGAWVVRPGKVVIRVAPPIPTKGLGPADREQLMTEARDEIARMMGPSAGSQG